MSHITKSKGFSLIEAMVASALVGIGFAGLLTMIAVSEQFMNRAIQTQKAQMVANQMLEIIESDLGNIDSYAMDLSTCPDAATASQWDVRRFEWCTRLDNELGQAGATNTRTITLSTLADGRRAVQIILQASNGRVQVIMTRAYDT